MVESVKKTAMVGSLVLNQNRFAFCLKFKKTYRYNFNFTWPVEAVVSVINLQCLCKWHFA